MDILRQRLQQAIEEGANLTIETSNETWLGTPIYLDKEWIEVLVVSVGDNDGKIEGEHQAWLIRLDRIEAIAAPAERWNARRLAEIPTLGKESPRE